MNFCWCTIMVDNMDDSLKFYQEVVGLSILSFFMLKIPTVSIYNL